MGSTAEDLVPGAGINENGNAIRNKIRTRRHNTGRTDSGISTGHMLFGRGMITTEQIFLKRGARLRMPNMRITGDHTLPKEAKYEKYCRLYMTITRLNSCVAEDGNYLRGLSTRNETKLKGERKTE